MTHTIVGAADGGGHDAVRRGEQDQGLPASSHEEEEWVEHQPPFLGRAAKGMPFWRKGDEMNELINYPRAFSALIAGVVTL